MYKLSALILSVAFLASSLNAGKIYVCTSKDYKGECSDVEFKTGDCKKLPFNDGVSSIRLNGYVCQFYTDKLCDPESQNTSFSWDQANLRNTTFNDQLTSFRC